MNTIYYRSIPKITQYFRPKTIQEAVALLNEYREEAKILAGGTDLLFAMRSRSVMPKYIVDITKISGLDQIRHDKPDTLVIGGLVTLRSAELSKTVKEECPPLWEALHQMASIQVRNMGTIAGNICRASPSGDTIAPLLALKAKIRIAGRNKSSILPLEKFFTKPGGTVLKDCEILIEIHVPKLPANTGTAFLRISRVEADLAKVIVAIALQIKDGICSDVGIALGGVAPTPFRAKQAEQVLKNRDLTDTLIADAAEVGSNEIKPITDVRSNADYRKAISRVLLRRAIDISWKKAQGVIH
jgi:CO/xanthine dehydrogenase FAD-binding subunit